MRAVLRVDLQPYQVRIFVKSVEVLSEREREERDGGSYT